VVLAPIQPGKPTQNAYIERFNRTFREEVLSVYVFSDLDEVRDESTRWQYDYNHDRPHLALDRQTPAGYLAKYEEAVRPAEAPNWGDTPSYDLISSIASQIQETRYLPPYLYL